MPECPDHGWECTGLGHECERVPDLSRIALDALLDTPLDNAIRRQREQLAATEAERYAAHGSSPVDKDEG